MLIPYQKQISKQNEISIYSVIPRNNELWYGSAVRSTSHGISIDHDAKQFHRDYLDLLLLLNQVKRRGDIFYANTIQRQTL